MIQVKWATGITDVPLRWDIWRFYYPWRFSWVAAKHEQVSVRDTSFSGTKGHLQTIHLPFKKLFVPDHPALLQFTCDQLRDEIVNEIVDKAEHFLRTDAGYSLLLDMVTSDATRMSAISSWICGNLSDISRSGTRDMHSFLWMSSPRWLNFDRETQIEEITRFVFSNKSLGQQARTSIGSCLLQKLIRIVVLRRKSLRNNVLQVLRIFKENTLLKIAAKQYLRLLMMLDFDAWFWCLILTLDFDAWFWRLSLMLVFDAWFDAWFWRLMK